MKKSLVTLITLQTLLSVSLGEDMTSSLLPQPANYHVYELIGPNKEVARRLDMDFKPSTAINLADLQRNAPYPINITCTKKGDNGLIEFRTIIRKIPSSLALLQIGIYSKVKADDTRDCLQERYFLVMPGKLPQKDFTLKAVSGRYQISILPNAMVLLDSQIDEETSSLEIKFGPFTDEAPRDLLASVSFAKNRTINRKGLLVLEFDHCLLR